MMMASIVMGIPMLLLVLLLLSETPEKPVVDGKILLSFMVEAFSPIDDKNYAKTRKSNIIPIHHPFVATRTNPTITNNNKFHHRSTATEYHKSSSSKLQTQLFNIYDDWRTDTIVVDTLPLDEETVQNCLEEFVESDYGTQMFGRHEKAANVGITGNIEFVELCGPEVTLQLSGKFWHKRSFVLGRAAMWLNARIPEVTDVIVADREELQDFEEIVDDITGEVLFRRDKRSEDFNGDRATMEYQGMDPDMRGPFPQSALGGPSGGSMINPM
ncbi:hypothetical protein IV203_012974 [Nitzschia inconspicua]|uniref:Uncharacterized protein n=1 Tax=Nitzschia inconspicua TaxID=303405 RepID=A0A9K3M493_9STRA|nr:hypothetical protein IV203_012974 [Nitzschia inconspicua]